MEKFCLLSMLCIVSCCYAHKETGNCYECVKNYVNSIKQNIFSICVSHILRHGIISFVTINKWFFSLPLTECHKAIETSSVTWAYSLSLSSNAEFSSGKLWQVSPFLSLSLTDTFDGAIVPHSVPFQMWPALRHRCLKEKHILQLSWWALFPPQNIQTIPVGQKEHTAKSGRCEIPIINNAICLKWFQLKHGIYSVFLEAH